MTHDFLKELGYEAHNARTNFFFDKFANILAQEKIEDLQIFPIPFAKVPILKMKYKNLLSIDISFVIIHNQQIEPNKISSFICEDSQSSSSIQAVQVCQKIQQIVEGYGIGKEKFSYYLKQIKIWAQQRSLYGQQYCYLGGIGWTILVANIFSLYSSQFQGSHQEEGQLVQFLLKFFQFYSKWEWPNPISIIDSQSSQKENINLNEAVYSKSKWNPISSSSDSNHLMPILTPGPNQINVAEQVTYSHLRIYQTEFQRTYKLIKKIVKGKMSLSLLYSIDQDPEWVAQNYDISNLIKNKTKTLDENKMLFSDLRKQFDFILDIDIISKIDNIEGLKESNYWNFFKYNNWKFQLGVESKIRALLTNLQQDLNFSQKEDFIVRLISDPDHHEKETQDEKETSILFNIQIGIKLISKKDVGTVNIQSPLNDFIFKVEQIRDQLKQLPQIEEYKDTVKKVIEMSDHTINLNVQKMKNQSQ